MRNVANALLILGAIYLSLEYGIHPLISIAMVLFGLGMWGFSAGADEQIEFVKSKSAYYDQRARYYRRKAELCERELNEKK